MCKKNSSRCLENDQVLFFWRSNTAVVHAVSRDFCVFKIFNICPIWAVLSVLGPPFPFLTKNWPKNMYHTAQTQNFHFDLSLTLWPWMILIIEWSWSWSLNGTDLDHWMILILIIEWSWSWSLNDLDLYHWIILILIIEWSWSWKC